ncbi:hypothetical protein EJB05_02156, partial [Eragrostis curvula]
MEWTRNSVDNIWQRVRLRNSIDNICQGCFMMSEVSFKPDLKKFYMTCLDEDVLALMSKRVVDMACTLGKTVMVELDGHELPIK